MNAELFGPSGPPIWAQVRGRTVGAMVCAGFGAYWLSWIAARRPERGAWFGAIAVIASALLICSVFQLRVMRKAPRQPVSPQIILTMNLWFLAIVAAEVAGIILGKPILAHFHRKDLYANWVGGVVGIHFFPLGRLFKMPIYYATAGGISAFAFGSLLIFQRFLRLETCAGGAGLVLWLTGALILWKNLSTLAEIKAQN